MKKGDSLGKKSNAIPKSNELNAFNALNAGSKVNKSTFVDPGSRQIGNKIPQM